MSRVEHSNWLNVRAIAPFGITLGLSIVCAMEIIRLNGGNPEVSASLH